MFEFSIALRYLLPKRRALSTSLIALLSIGVISLVVWLLVVFLSVTTGLEKGWLNKLTSLHAPLRVSPSPEYFNSYYYNVDKIALNSDYQLKTIREKLSSPFTDPYQKEFDRELPLFWEKADRNSHNELVDPVKGLFSCLDMMDYEKSLYYQDYEISAALMKLTLANDLSSSLQVLSQMSYLQSLTDQNPKLEKLLVGPRLEDLNQITKSLDQKDAPAFFSHSQIEKVIADSSTNYSLYQFQLKKPIKVYFDQDQLIFSDQSEDGFTEQILTQEDGNFFLDGKDQLDLSQTVLLDYKDPLEVQIQTSKHQIYCEFKKGFNLTTSFFPFTIVEASPQSNFVKTPVVPPLWAYHVQNEGTFFPNIEKTPVLLPKAYQKNGAVITTFGELSYHIITPTASQEQKLPFQVVGFYDPGILPLGSKLVIVPNEITSIINSQTTPISPDDSPLNGVFVWTDLDETPIVKEKLIASLEKEGISQYWLVEDYKEYSFAKDLLEQFQSDRTLFSLIGIIILIVACCNIISLLIMLVNDKKKEIALLQALGASKKSIALIFGFCGIILGTLGTVLGIALAKLTLYNMGAITNFLSAIQGHQAFNPAFFGESLPSTLSVESIFFICLVTPIIALLAGLVPAIKAARIKPARVLRSV